MDFYDIRVRFKKTGDARFISHLDLSRFMQRALKRSRLPIWHTEGFNPHPYVTFALPLSLGQSGECEVMDFRLNEEKPYEEVFDALKAVLPPDISPVCVAQPWEKAKAIAFAEYVVVLPGHGGLIKQANALFEQKELIVEKTTKSGSTQIDIAPLIKNACAENECGDLKITMTLPAGPVQTINPTLFINALAEFTKTDLSPARITRTKIFNGQGKIFE